MLTDLEFEALVEERAKLRAEHESLCETINEYYNPFCGEDPHDPRCIKRDVVYSKLVEFDERYEETLDQERATER
jgi:hypothetical protein